MDNRVPLPEEEILAKLCEKYEVKQELIHELLSIERGYQDHAKRRGIFQQISELLKADMSK